MAFTSDTSNPEICARRVEMMQRAREIAAREWPHASPAQLADLARSYATAMAVDAMLHPNSTVSAGADQGGKRHVDRSASRAPVDQDSPVARAAGRAEAEGKASPAVHIRIPDLTPIPTAVVKPDPTIWGDERKVA